MMWIISVVVNPMIKVREFGVLNVGLKQELNPVQKLILFFPEYNLKKLWTVRITINR